MRRVTVITLLCLLLSDISLAQTTYTFTGEGGTPNWNVPQNWNPQGVPGPNDIAIIPDREPGRIYDVGLTSNVTVGKLIVGRDNTFDLRGYNLTLQQGGTMAEGSRLFFGSSGTLTVAADSFVVHGEVNFIGRIAGTGQFINRGRLYTSNTGATIAGNLINYGTVDVSNGYWRFAQGGSYTNYGSTTITLSSGRYDWYTTDSSQPLSTIRNYGRWQLQLGQGAHWMVGYYNPSLLRFELYGDTLYGRGQNSTVRIYSQALLSGNPTIRLDSIAWYFQGQTTIADSVSGSATTTFFFGQWGGTLSSADSSRGAVLHIEGSGFGLGGETRLSGRILNRGRLYTSNTGATIAGNLINYGTVDVSNGYWRFAQGGSYTNYGSTTITLSSGRYDWYTTDSSQPLSTIRNYGRWQLQLGQGAHWMVGYYNPSLLRFELYGDTLYGRGQNSTVRIYSQALLSGNPTIRLDSIAWYFQGQTTIADSVSGSATTTFFFGQWGGTLSSADSSRGAVLHIEGSGFGLGGGTRLSGRILNRGRLYASGSASVYLTGSLINQGILELNTLFVTGRERRTLWLGENARASVQVIDRATLIGNNYLPNVQIGSSGLLIVQDTLELGSGPFSGVERILVTGVVRSRLKHAPSTFIMPGLRLEGVSGVDSTRSLHIAYYGLSTPASFSNATLGWWRFSPVDSATTPTAQRLILPYNQAALGGISEDSLFVFYSPDGTSWQLFSGSLTRDSEANTFTLQQAPLRGLYAIAQASASPIDAVPALHVEIVGRPTLRIGAPNRYTVLYTNLGRVPTGPILIRLQYDPAAMRLDYVELSRLNDDAPIRLPADSVLIEPGLIVILGRSLNFAETASFDLVFTGLPGALSKRAAYAEPQALPVIGIGTLVLNAGKLAIAWAISGLVSGYINDLMTTFFCEELWDPVSPDADVKKELSKAFADALAKTNAEWFSWQKVKNEIVNNVKDEIKNKVKENVIPKYVQEMLEGPINVASLAYNILECLWKGANRCMNPNPKVNATPPKPERLELPQITGLTSQGDCGVNLSYELQPIRSWDPNEKAGPAGIGEGNYLNEVGRLHYTIFFENLATATAPAYRIVIVDTLAAELDPESVEFGKTSHKGWQITRQGNVLRWEIEGIELPPNVNPPEGEGFVTFSILPRPGVVVDGTRIENRATIVFDMNPPIMTNTVVNTFDLSPPAITLLPLPEEVNQDTLVVRWQAQDAGSGVARVFLFRAIDGGPFEQVATVSGGVDSVRIAVEPDRRYTFYALAQDFVGNTMQRRSNEVSTRVVIVSTEKTPEALPERFVLDAIYPNPFRTHVTFRVGLPKQERVRLVVYDLLGREVGRVVDQELPAGWHELRWTEPELASGLYLVRFEAERTQQVRTFLKVH